MIRELAATVLYSGYLPAAPGTFGSLASMAMAFLVWLVIPEYSGWIILGLAAVLLPIGARLGTWAEIRWGRKDPHCFVLDELVGSFLAIGLMLIIFPRYPIEAHNPAVPAFWFFFVPFIYFRIFDVRKPYPVHQVESVPGGWGIMLDDLVAGGYALIFSVGTLLAVRLIPLLWQNGTHS